VVEMKLYRVVVWPFESVYPEVVSFEDGVGKQAVLVGHEEHNKDRIRDKNQFSTESKKSRCLGNPQMRIRPQCCSLLGDHEVEGLTGERQGLGDGVDQWKV